MVKNIKILAVILVVLAVSAYLLRDKIFPEQVVVLETPGENATDEEEYAYTVQNAALAERTDLLDVTNCIATPEILKVQNGSSFSIRNEGNSDRILYFYKREPVTVPANSTIQYDAFFGDNRSYGLYGYACDLITDGRAGQILTTH